MRCSSRFLLLLAIVFTTGVAVGLSLDWLRPGDGRASASAPATGSDGPEDPTDRMTPADSLVEPVDDSREIEAERSPDEGVPAAGTPAPTEALSGPSLFGTVRGSGPPLPRPWVQALRQFPGEPVDLYRLDEEGKNRRTSEQGAFEFPDLRPGPYLVAVSRGRSTPFLDWTSILVEDAPVEASFSLPSLEPHEFLTVRAITDAGEPAELYQLSLHTEHKSWDLHPWRLGPDEFAALFPRDPFLGPRWNEATRLRGTNRVAVHAETEFASGRPGGPLVFEAHAVLEILLDGGIPAELRSSAMIGIRKSTRGVFERLTRETQAARARLATLDAGDLQDMVVRNEYAEQVRSLNRLELELRRSQESRYRPLLENKELDLDGPTIVHLPPALVEVVLLLVVEWFPGRTQTIPIACQEIDLRPGVNRCVLTPIALSSLLVQAPGTGPDHQLELRPTNPGASLDFTWVRTVGVGGQAQFEHLPPGEYRLLLRRWKADERGSRRGERIAETTVDVPRQAFVEIR